jgi:hypothetical protein
MTPARAGLRARQRCGSGSESFELRPKSPAPELHFLLSSPRGEAAA